LTGTSLEATPGGSEAKLLTDENDCREEDCGMNGTGGESWVCWERARFEEEEEKGSVEDGASSC